MHLVGVEMSLVLGAILAPELDSETYVFSHNLLVFIIDAIS